MSRLDTPTEQNERNLSPTEDGTERVTLDSSEITDREREIITTAISQEYGYSTCVDESIPVELSSVVHKIFTVDAGLKHFSSDRVLVGYRGDEYLSNYGVSVA